MVRAQDASLNIKEVDAVDTVEGSVKLFNDFIQAQTCHQTFSAFLELCRAINLPYPPSPSSSNLLTNEHSAFYPHLKKKLSSWKAQSVWAKLDKRFYGKEYFVNPRLHKSSGQRAGDDTKVLIIGAGPCGLRTAIDMACLGTKVVVLEKRDSFSRNNVLHLWPFIITDLKALGAKKLYGRFCAGALDHISIRQLQLILLKIALMLGVEIIFNVSFQDLSPPTVACEDTEQDGKGWTAAVDPVNHPVSKFQFDVVVGADGKRNTLQGFNRKEFRGKLAIGLTVNFINRNTTAEAKVEEISGVAYIFNQEFFRGLHKETGIDLENIVYYKGETHYFVMTAKKQSLLSKGVLKQDFDDTLSLLSYDNVDRDAMLTYAKEAADFSTHHQLPTLDFAINHFGEPDVALFDFTCMYAAVNAAMFREIKGHKLLACLVGDSLLEPFWPMGTGCARGFLAAFDTVWMTRQWALRRADMCPTDNTVELQVLAERESIYRLLHQTNPQNTIKNLASYTIDPNTRYVNLNNKAVTPRQVTCYYVSDRPAVSPTASATGKTMTIEHVEAKGRKDSSRGTFTRKVSMVRSSKLQSWCRRMTDGYEGFHLVDMAASWKNGLALCALIHRFRPELISWSDLLPGDIEGNNQLAFDVAEKHLGISPVLTGKEMASCDHVDKLLIVTYVSQFYEIFKHETPTGLPPSLEANPNAHVENGEAPKSPTGFSLSSPVGLLSRLSQHLKRRGSYSVQSKQEESSKKKKHSLYKKKDAAVFPDQSLSIVPEHGEHQQNAKGTADSGAIGVDESTVKLRGKKETSDGPSNSGKPNVNQRVSNRISELSSQLISQWEQNAPQPSPRAVKRENDVSDLSVPPSASDKCYFCLRRVYIVERLSAEGHFFHRQCFVCFHCGLTLRRGTYEYVKETGKFFCGLSCASAASSGGDEKTRAKEDVAERDGVKESVVLNYQTPERIELENATAQQDREELTEEALARHNLTLSRDQPGIPADPMDEELTSDSSDDDISWDEILREANHKKSSLSDESSMILESSLEELPQSHSSTLVRRKTVTNLDSCKSYTELDRAAIDKTGNKEREAEPHIDQADSQQRKRADVPVRFANPIYELGPLRKQSDAVGKSQFANPTYEPVEAVGARPVPLPRSRSKKRESELDAGQLDNGQLADTSNKAGDPTDVDVPDECVFLSVSEAELLRHREETKQQSLPSKCRKYYIPKNELSLLLKYTSEAVQSEKSSFPNFKEHRSILNVISDWLLGEKSKNPPPKSAAKRSAQVEDDNYASDLSVADISSGEDVSEGRESDSGSSLAQSVPEEGNVGHNATNDQLSATSPTNFTKEAVSARDSLSSASTASHSGDREADVTTQMTSLATNTHGAESPPSASKPEPTPRSSAPAKKSRSIFDILRKSPTAATEKTDESADVVADLPSARDDGGYARGIKKADTLDRVQQYLLKTPITPIQAYPSDVTSQPDHRRSPSSASTASTISLSSSSSDGEHETIVRDDDGKRSTDDQSLTDVTQKAPSPVATIKKLTTPKTDPANFAIRPIRVLPRQSSVDSIMINASRSARNDTTQWTSLEDEESSSSRRERSGHISLNDSIISEYHPAKDDEQPKSNSSLIRKLSFDSIERRMKFRLRARNRWLREESNFQRPLSRSSSGRSSSNNKETPFHSVPSTDKPTSPAVSPPDMLIIEMTPSVGTPLTPTAPPDSRKHSYDGDSEHFFTPMTKSPPARVQSRDPTTRSIDPDLTGDFVSAPSTPFDRSGDSGSDVSGSDVATSKRGLPSLPKVPHLEAISPTGTAHRNPGGRKRDIEREVEERGERVKRTIEEKMLQKQEAKRIESFLHQSGDGLGESFSGYSPVPSRKKSSLKKRNRKSKTAGSDDAENGGIDSHRLHSRDASALDESRSPLSEGARNQQKRNRKKETADAKSPPVKSGNPDKEAKEKRSSRLFFGIASRRKNKNKKDNKSFVDDTTTLERKYPDQSERERAIVRGERFRVPTSSIITPQSSVLESYDSPAEDELNKYWSTRRRRTHISGLTPEQIDAKITRRVQVAARRQARLEAQKRLRRAQVIQRQLEEVEVKQKDLEVRGVELEKMLRDDADQKEESRHMQEWFKMVQEKNALLRYENELMIHQRELQLEDVQSRLQQDLRERMALDDKKKSGEELEKEKEILQKMLEVVEQRDELVALLEEQRIKERDEFVDAETLLLNKFNDFPNDSNWTASSRDSYN